MYSSFTEVGLVPPGTVTVTSTVPVPAGASAVSNVSEITVMSLAGLPVPKSTTVAPVRLVPVTSTKLPPVAGPWLGDTALTVG